MLGTGSWLDKPSSDTALVFVHGILSSPEGAWGDPKGTAFWPYLARGDQRLGACDVFLAHYSSDAGSGASDLMDAARTLMSQLSAPDAHYGVAPIGHPRVIFVAHSLGGVVVRQLLCDHPQLVSGKHVGCLYLGVPIRGVDLATVADSVTGQVSGHALLESLQRDSPALEQLQRRCVNFEENNNCASLTVREFAEERPILPNSWGPVRRLLARAASLALTGNPDWLMVVPASQAGLAARAPLLAGTTHSSIAKPTELGHPSHHELMRLVQRMPKAVSGAVAIPTPVPALGSLLAKAVAPLHGLVLGTQVQISMITVTVHVQDDGTYFCGREVECKAGGDALGALPFFVQGDGNFADLNDVAFQATLLSAGPQTCVVLPVVDVNDRKEFVVIFQPPFPPGAVARVRVTHRMPQGGKKLLVVGGPWDELAYLIPSYAAEGRVGRFALRVTLPGTAAIYEIDDYERVARVSAGDPGWHREWPDVVKGRPLRVRIRRVS